MELKIKGKKGNTLVNSEEVKNILQARPDFSHVRDISDSANQDSIMIFDCTLAYQLFNELIEELCLEDLGVELELDESFQPDIYFEDIRDFIKDMADEIEEELQEIYYTDDLRCHFDIYHTNEAFNDFKFVFLVSFKSIKLSSIANLAKIVSRKQLSGDSKYYN
jgi:hypothetical protein